MKGSATWKSKKNFLWNCIETEFQVEILPYLRILWPTMVQMRPKGKRDSCGIDLLFMQEDEISVVVQCKGFQVERLEAKQIRQSTDSIASFLESGLKTRQYIFIHNRDGRHRQYEDAVERSLKGLMEAGRVDSVSLWNLDTLPEVLAECIEKRIATALVRHTAYQKSRHERLFDFRRPTIEHLPAKESWVYFRRSQPCEIVDGYEHVTYPIATIPKDTNAARWTIITGVFGVGKTTVGLELATKYYEAKAVFVPCHVLSHDTLTRHPLLESILVSIGFLFDTEDEESGSCLDPRSRNILIELAGPVFKRMLNRPDNDYLLIFDALDENVLFSRLDYMEQFINSLSGLRCRIVISSRSELLKSMFGNFEMVFQEFTVRNSPKKPGCILELLLWRESHVIAFLNGLDIKNNQVRQRIHALVNIVSRRDTSLYGSLLSHPLFLSFIVEDVIDGGIQGTNQTALIDRWIRRKLNRDIKMLHRPSVNRHQDANQIISMMLNLMTNLAGEMLETESGEIQLRESVDQGQVLKLMRRMSISNDQGVLPVLLNTLLVPLEYSRVSLQYRLRLGFCLRVVQEYFLAQFMLANSLDPERYPREVRIMYYELVRQ